ncbi:MAG: methyltransferase domain-containing protein [Pirellulales bacterium]|nr:methyltransferase domain-containing protein [Pirellulales bacterium]
MSEVGLFFRECLRNFHTTGAVLPSGEFLGKALVRYVAEPADQPRRILEVGPGTGAVTRRILEAMQPQDTLDLVELNATFVRQLERRMQTDPRFLALGPRLRLHHAAVEELPPEEPFDIIISGLPLNNFSLKLVRQILEKLFTLLRPGGSLSFFEYIAVRRVKSLVSNRIARQRLRGIDRTVQRIRRAHGIARQAVWLNVPPAWVHHLRIDPPEPVAGIHSVGR